MIVGSKRHLVGTNKELGEGRAGVLAAVLPLLRMVVIDGSANLAEDIGMVDDKVLADVEREFLRVLQCLEGLEELRRLILDVLRGSVAILDGRRKKLQRRAQLAQAVENVVRVLLLKELDRGLDVLDLALGLRKAVLHLIEVLGEPKALKDAPQQHRPMIVGGKRHKRHLVGTNEELGEGRAGVLAAVLPLLRMVVIDGSANLVEDVGMVDDEVLADVERELFRVLQCLEGLEELRRLILDVLRGSVAILDGRRKKLQRRAQLAQAVENVVRVLLLQELDRGLDVLDLALGVGVAALHLIEVLGEPKALEDALQHDWPLLLSSRGGEENHKKHHLCYQALTS